MIVLSVGSITGVLCADHTIRNSTKEAFQWLRIDSTLFLIACCGLYHFQNTVDHVSMTGALAITYFLYFSYFFICMNREISQYLGIPFFSLKKKQN